MVNDGYEDVVNVDISSVVIEAMQTKYSNCQQLRCIHSLSSLFKSKYEEMKWFFFLQFFSFFFVDIKLDVRDMSPFQAGSFAAVIDKGVFFFC